MKRILALTAFAGAVAFAASGASALECENDYTELGNGVPLLCEEGTGTAAEAGVATEQEAIEGEAIAAEAPATEAPAPDAMAAPQSDVAASAVEVPQTPDATAAPDSSAASMTAEAQAAPLPAEPVEEETSATAFAAGPECENGYAQLGNGVILNCGEQAAAAEVGLEAEAGMAADATAPAPAPEATSVTAATEAPAPAEEMTAEAAVPTEQAAAEAPAPTDAMVAAEAEPAPLAEPAEDANAFAAGPECENGYAQLGNGVIIQCDGGVGPMAAADVAPSGATAPAPEPQPSSGTVY